MLTQSVEQVILGEDTTFVVKRTFLNKQYL